MTDHKLVVDGSTFHLSDQGTGPTVVLLHGLGMDHTVWAPLRADLPGIRTLAPDLRGHGQSDAPKGPYTMGRLIKDVEAMLDTLDIRDAVVIGLSLGGMIAQGLAVKRLDQVRGLGLIATAAKFGQPAPWHDRAASARATGINALAPDILARWNVTTPAAQDRLLRTNPEGYAATCEAIAGTDFYTPTSGLRLPTLGLCGDRDKSTPPDLVRETTHLVPGASFALIKGAGHLAPETHPKDVATHLRAFLKNIGHL